MSRVDIDTRGSTSTRSARLPLSGVARGRAEGAVAPQKNVEKIKKIFLMVYENR